MAWTLGIASLISYNWWVLAPFKPGLMRSPDELFSNLEVTGQPYASVMQHADLLAGLLLLGAFWAVGATSIPGGGREWLAMMFFAVGGALGGLFPEQCADGINAVCRNMEWSFLLPLSQYLHIIAGLIEFGAITIALVLAFRRTRDLDTRSARAYHHLYWGMFVAYPLLGLAYLLDTLGAVMEGVFFVGFTVMVVAQLAERTRSIRPR
ncbi:MAG: DUF998 domain-containing protein [Acidimicrobiales bacterium]